MGAVAKKLSLLHEVLKSFQAHMTVICVTLAAVVHPRRHIASFECNRLNDCRTGSLLANSLSATSCLTPTTREECFCSGQVPLHAHEQDADLCNFLGTLGKVFGPPGHLLEVLYVGVLRASAATRLRSVSFQSCFTCKKIFDIFIIKLRMCVHVCCGGH